MEIKEYANGSENSGIVKYKYDENSIEVQFKDGSVYRYTAESAGATNIEIMKHLADTGKKLNSFINVNVRSLYEAKLW